MKTVAEVIGVSRSNLIERMRVMPLSEAAAAPPRSVMNARRLMSHNGPPSP